MVLKKIIELLGEQGLYCEMNTSSKGRGFNIEYDDFVVNTTVSLGHKKIGLFFMIPVKKDFILESLDNADELGEIGSMAGLTRPSMNDEFAVFVFSSGFSIEKDSEEIDIQEILNIVEKFKRICNMIGHENYRAKFSLETTV